MPPKCKREQDSEPAAPNPDRKILVAVDFGTTFSGLAWAQIRKPKVQVIINQWPGSIGAVEGISSEKVPTELQYNGQTYKWGFQIADSGQRYQWFKLGLDQSQRHDGSKLAKVFPYPMASLPGYDKHPEKLVADFLTVLRKHAEHVLSNKLLKSVMQSTPVEFIITVPAVWSDAAQAKIRACAEKAGMGFAQTLNIISEPEAAAIYALDAMDPHDIKINDTFVLCDAGGGTVDLISYTVLALKPTMKISEAAPGTGSLCGSSYLNRIFQKFIEDHLGSEPDWDEDVLEEAMKRFEFVIKRQFRGIADEDFMIPVPGLSDNAELNVRRGRLRVTGTEVKAIFEPVVLEVIALVKSQIAATMKPVKAVLLVGGFGQSTYLCDRIRRAIGTDIEVMQSPNGWTAIVRGALMKVLASTTPALATVQISGRSARKHYGLSGQKRFDFGYHDMEHRFWSSYHKAYRIDTMDWYIQKGDTVNENEPLRLGYHETFLKSNGKPPSVEIDIYHCPDPLNTGPPMYDHSDGVTKLATLQADLRKIPTAKFPTETGKDKLAYYVVYFEVEITHYSAYTKYELLYDGTNYGKVAAEYV